MTRTPGTRRSVFFKNSAVHQVVNPVCKTMPRAPPVAHPGAGVEHTLLYPGAKHDVTDPFCIPGYPVTRLICVDPVPGQVAASYFRTAQGYYDVLDSQAGKLGMTAASGQGAADEVWRWEGNERSLVYIHSTRIEELVLAHRHAALIAPCDAVVQKKYWLFRNRAIANVISNGTSMEHCLLYEQSSFEKKGIAVEVPIVTETVGAARPNIWWHVFGNAKYQSALKERQARARAGSYQYETVESAVSSGGRVLDQPVSFLKGPTAWKLRAEFSQDYAQLAKKNWYGNL